MSYVQNKPSASSIRRLIVTFSNNRVTKPPLIFHPDFCAKEKIIFISADYRLLLPSTGFDITADVKTLFNFLASPEFSVHLPSDVTLDTSRIAVNGESGGGYPAYAAGIYASPKPRAVLLQFSMGGQMLVDHWIMPKDGQVAPFGDVKRDSVARFLDHKQEPISNDPLAMMNAGTVEDSGRAMLLAVWLKTGELVDRLLGREISSMLRKLPLEERETAIPKDLKPAMLQMNLDKHFPPTFLMHGAADPLVPPIESVTAHERLTECGVKSELHLVIGGGHGLRDPGNFANYVPGAAEVKERAMEWLREALQLR